MAELVLKDEAFAVVGACFEVYNEIGTGFLEAVYQECLEKELSLRGVPFASQPHIPIYYKGMPIEKSYQPDLICFDKVVVELKAVSDLTDTHRAQTLNYVRAAKLPLALLINFGTPNGVQHERFALTH